MTCSYCAYCLDEALLLRAALHEENVTNNAQAMDRARHTVGIKPKGIQRAVRH